MGDISDDEIFEKKEPKKINLKFLKNKKIVTAIICLLIVIVLVCFEFNTRAISGLFDNSKGNTAGNLHNCGYSVAHGNYIYYVSPDEEMINTHIYKVKNGSTERESIYKGEYDIRALNIVGNRIYFIGLSYNTEREDQLIDHKMYSMNLDGSDIKVINDNEFSEDYYDVMYIVKNKIYYVGEDKNVYKMNLDGSNRKLALESNAGFTAVNEKYIIFNKIEGENEDEISYIKDLRTGDERQINGSKAFTPEIYDDYIYYINSEEKLVKVPVTGGDEEIVHDGSTYNLNINNGYAYYLNYKDAENDDYTVCVFKIDLKNGEKSIVKELSYYSSFINIVNGQVYYMDMDETRSFINLVDVNNSQETTLYEWKYDEMNGQEENTDVQEDVVNEETNDSENQDENEVSEETEEVTE